MGGNAALIGQKLASYPDVTVHLFSLIPLILCLKVIQLFFYCNAHKFFYLFVAYSREVQIFCPYNASVHLLNFDTNLIINNKSKTVPTVLGSCLSLLCFLRSNCIDSYRISGGLPVLRLTVCVGLPVLRLCVCGSACIKTVCVWVSLY